jgi:hypothetical protein
MAPSVAGTSTKTLRPTEIEIPRTSSTNNDNGAPELLSPRSWRHRAVTYQPPSRRQTNGSLDAEDYFVGHIEIRYHLHPLTSVGWSSRHVQALEMALLHAHARLCLSQDDSPLDRRHSLVHSNHLRIRVPLPIGCQHAVAYCPRFRCRSRYFFPYQHRL